MRAIVATLNAKYIHTSLALRYLKAYAHPEFQIDIKEFTIKDDPLDIASKLYAQKPHVIGFSCYIWNIRETIPVISILKKIMPDTVIILGGPEVTYNSEEWLKELSDVDIIVRGEGEHTFKSLLSMIQSGGSWDDVPGITYRRNDEIYVNPPAPKLDLNDIPSPYRFETDLPNLSKRITYVETSRGCPFRCQFCLSSVEFGVRYFDIDQMKDDLKYLMDRGAKTIKFIDRTFNLDKEYALEIFDFLIKNHHPGNVFQFEITADIMKPEVLEFINRHAPKGLFRFEIGVQSTNDQTNRLIKRWQDFNKLSRTVNLIKEGGKVVQHLDLIAGLPEEDYDSFKKTFNDVFALKPEELQLGFLKMLRGTGLRTEAKKWDYQYMNHAPYEVLSNNVLSFEDVTRIKQVEDILEKYWNKQFFNHTIPFITDHVFSTPFDFFQGFGTYWHDRGWNKIGHQLTDLFRRLDQFLQEQDVADLDIIEGLMHIDYYRNFKQKPHTAWKDELSAQQKQKVYDKLWEEHDFSDFGFKKWDLKKHVVLHRVTFNVQTYLTTGQIIHCPGWLLVIYSPKKHEPMFDFFSEVSETNS